MEKKIPDFRFKEAWEGRGKGPDNGLGWTIRVPRGGSLQPQTSAQPLNGPGWLPWGQLPAPSPQPSPLSRDPLPEFQRHPTAQRGASDGSEAPAPRPGSWTHSWGLRGDRGVQEAGPTPPSASVFLGPVCVLRAHTARPALDSVCKRKALGAAVCSRMFVCLPGPRARPARRPRVPPGAWRSRRIRLGPRRRLPGCRGYRGRLPLSGPAARGCRRPEVGRASPPGFSTPQALESLQSPVSSAGCKLCPCSLIPSPARRPGRVRLPARRGHRCGCTEVGGCLAG